MNLYSDISFFRIVCSFSIMFWQVVRWRLSTEGMILKSALLLVLRMFKQHTHTLFKYKFKLTSNHGLNFMGS
jgi:hypothetical protein